MRLAALLLLLAMPAWAQDPPRLLGLTAEGGDFRAEVSDGRVLRGADLMGAVLRFDAVEIRIDAAQRDAEVPSARPDVAVTDVWLFRLSARQPGGDWGSFCEPDPRGERWGMPWQGPDGGLRLTCSAGGIGKCIRFGYRPWASLPDGRSLAPFHAACLNMLRGAYGDPVRGWTRDGTPIDVYDRVGIQAPANDPGQDFEAGWTPDGAVCVAHPRIPEHGGLDAIVAHAPRLAGRTGPETCTEERAAALGALVFNRSFRR
jgi:hypothetical protein